MAQNWNLLDLSDPDQDGDASNLEQIQNTFEKLLHQKIAINFADQSELLNSGLFDIYQVNNLIQYRERSGKILSHFELLQIKGFDKNKVIMLQDYLDYSIIEPRLILYKPWLQHKNKHELAWRWGQELVPREGFTSGLYQGPSYESRFRYRYYNGRHLSMGLCLQKDPGENGFDHQSFFLEIKNWAWLKKLCIGDFINDFGQGLSLSHAFNSGSSLFTTPITKSKSNFRSVAGSDEERFFRGLAAYAKLGPFQQSFFYSYRLKDGSNDSSQIQVYSDGLHRSQSEKDRIKQLKEGFICGSLSYENQRLQVAGLIWSRKLENRFQVSSSRQNSSLSLSYSKSRFHIQGEYSQNWRGGFHYLMWLQGLWTEKVYGTFSFYQKNSRFSSPFGRNPISFQNTKAESGLLAQLNANLSYRRQWAARIQLARMPEGDYLIKGPMDQLRTILQFKSEENSGTWQLRLKFQQRSFWDKSPENIEMQSFNQAEGRLRLIWQKGISTFTNLKQEIAFTKSVGTSNNTSLGYLYALSCKFQLKSNQLKVGLSMAHCEAWENRFYLYEDDLRYSFSIPARYGSSMRFYGLYHHNLRRYLTLEGRLDVIKFYDRDVISSGSQQIAGSIQAQLKLQVLIKF